MRFIGIDPGKKGAVVVLDLKGKPLFLEPMEDVFWFVSFIKEMISPPYDKNVMVFCEKAQAMPQNGVVAMFNYGTHFGEIQGVLAANKLVFELVAPMIWTKVMHMGIVADKPKLKSAIAARRLFPDTSLIDPNGSPSSVRVHEGIVDALLIAEYGRRKFNNIC